MSGHSHWKKIKHAKGAADAQKGKAFSKMARLITVAAREGGDVEKNPKLRLAIAKAKEINLPAENIKRAIKRGTGEIGGAELQEILFEAYGPGNIAIIIEGITDNKNRTIAEIKHILNQNNGKLAGEGSVRWLFERKGVISLNRKLQTEDFQEKGKLELAAIDAGAQDLVWRADNLEVHTRIDNLEEVKKKLIERGIKIESSSLDWVPKEEIPVSAKEREAAEKLFEALDENDSVQEIYSNLKV